MVNYILMDEFHVGVFAPRGLSAAEYDAVRKALDGAPFRSRLKRTMRKVVRRYASLNIAQLVVTR